MLRELFEVKFSGSVKELNFRQLKAKIFRMRSLQNYFSKNPSSGFQEAPRSGVGIIVTLVLTNFG